MRLIPELHKQYEWLCFAYYRGAFYHEFEVSGRTLFVRRRNAKYGTRRFSYYGKGQ